MSGLIITIEGNKDGKGGYDMLRREGDIILIR